jgi:tetratricopeptide (TPR) repeat protein
MILNISLPIGALIGILVLCIVLFILDIDVRVLHAGRNLTINKSIVNAPELLYNISQHTINLIDEGEYEQAIQMLNETLNLYPNFTNAIISTGDAMYYLGQYDKAIEMYDRAIEMDAKDTYALINKGLALSELGQYDKAIELYDRAIEIDDTDTDAIFYKGLIIWDCTMKL